MIKNELEPFLREINVRPDLIIYESSETKNGMSFGTNYFTSADAVIMLAQNFFRVDKDACRFVIKHELSHVLNNDTFNIFLVSGICMTPFSILESLFLTLNLLGLLTAVLGFLSFCIYFTYRETKADDFAIAHSSSDELKGGLRFMKAQIAINLASPDSIYKKLFISKSGESLLDITHPSSSSRIQKIEAALQARNVILDQEEEINKIHQLVACLS